MLDDIIEYYEEHLVAEKDKKTTGYQHYVDYQSKKLTEYEKCRNLLTLVLATVVPSVPAAVVSEADAEDDEDGSTDSPVTAV